LSMRVDQAIKCSTQKTAYELAVESDNKIFLEVLNRFHNSSGAEEEILDQEVAELHASLAASYAFRPEATLFVKPFKANFPVPKFLFKKDRLGSIPYGMTIQEAHLQPLTDTGYDLLRGTNSLHCIEFSLTQSEINEKRREVLVKTFDGTWEPLSDGEHITDSILYKNSKKKHGRR
jgi:hypothetical protein